MLGVWEVVCYGCGRSCARGVAGRVLDRVLEVWEVVC